MSNKSQELNMRRLAALLSQDLSYIGGERECGPNGAKRTFLNVGKTFLRALAKDLCLHDVTVRSNAGGIAVSGECCLYGMWENKGIFIEISQSCCSWVGPVLYRTIRNAHDHKGGHSRYLSLNDLKKCSYNEVLECFSSLRKGYGCERAA